MADVSIKIQLQDTIEDAIGGVSANKATNNVSSIVSKNTKKNDGIPLLSFASGYIKFDVDGNLVNADGVAGKAILEGSYNGFVFGATNESGEYSVTLTITGSHIDSLIFYGDRLANQFPTEAYLDGDTANKIYSDDSIWAIVFDTSTTSHTVTFTKWNRANYNACFTHIAVLRNELWLDKAWIKNVESVSQSTGQPSEIFYGVIANSGSAEILDRNGELLDYITDGIIENSNLPISIWANGKQAQAHITNDSDYDTNSITLSFEMTNDFDDWNNINYSGYSYPETSKNAYEMLSDVLKSIGYQNDYSNNYTGQLIDEMLSENIIIGNSINDNIAEMSVKLYLQYINIPYPYLEADTIKNTIDKFCTLAQLQVCKDDNNEIKFVSARPAIATSEFPSVLVVPSKYELSQLSETKILKNKYTLVELNEKIVSSNLDINTNVYTKEINDFNTDLSNCDAQYITVDYYSGSALTEYVCARIEGTYTSGSFTVPKSSNYNLDKIEKVYEYDKDNEKTTWNMSYQKYYNDDFRFWTSQKFNAFMNENYKFDDVAYNKGDIANGQIDIFSATQVSEHDSSKSVTATLADNNSITITERDSDYLVEYNILTEVSCFTGKFSLSRDETPSDLGHQFIGQANKYSALSLDVSIYGNKRTINFSDNNESDYSISNNIVSINNSELLQENTVVSHIDFENSIILFAKSIELIKNNIKDDYKNGVSNSRITISCSNYYDINGNLAKDWSKGEIIQVGDIVRVDKDNAGNSASNYKDGTPRLWRVTGRTFRKQGVPLIDLELQEIVQYPVPYKMTETEKKDCSLSYYRISSIVKDATLGTIDLNTPIYYGDVIKITATPNTNKEIVTFKINSNDYKNNSEYTVLGDINIECLCYGWEKVSNFESITINLESGESNIDINKEYFAVVDDIIANKDIRVFGYCEVAYIAGYYPQLNSSGHPVDFHGDGNLDYTQDNPGKIYLYDVEQKPSSGGGLVVGTIYFLIKKPTQDGQFIYTNYTSVGEDNAYLSKFIFTRIEQYL